jgi:hypothetical protein
MKLIVLRDGPDGTHQLRPCDMDRRGILTGAGRVCSVVWQAAEGRGDEAAGPFGPPSDEGDRPGQPDVPTHQAGGKVSKVGEMVGPQSNPITSSPSRHLMPNDPWAGAAGEHPERE